MHRLILTRNTFCGTWYLPHSWVTIMFLCSSTPISYMTWKTWCCHHKLGLYCTFFDSHAWNCLISLQIFQCAAFFNLPYFYFRCEIWRHHHASRPGIPVRCQNFGDSAMNYGYIACFSCTKLPISTSVLKSDVIWRQHCVPQPRYEGILVIREHLHIYVCVDFKDFLAENGENL